MKALFKIKTAVLLLFIVCSCSEKNILAQNSNPILDSMDIVFIKSFEDSVDIQSLESLYEIATTDHIMGIMIEGTE